MELKTNYKCKERGLKNEQNVKNEELMKNVKNVKANKCEEWNLVTTSQLVILCIALFS
jgi:hypothetical protein